MCCVVKYWRNLLWSSECKSTRKGQVRVCVCVSNGKERKQLGGGSWVETRFIHAEHLYFCLSCLSYINYPSFWIYFSSSRYYLKNISTNFMKFIGNVLFLLMLRLTASLFIIQHIVIFFIRQSLMIIDTKIKGLNHLIFCHSHTCNY